MGGFVWSPQSCQDETEVEVRGRYPAPLAGRNLVASKLEREMSSTSM